MAANTNAFRTVFFNFWSFLHHFSVMKIALIFSKCLKVSPLTAHVNSKCLAMWLCVVQLWCNSSEILYLSHAVMVEKFDQKACVILRVQSNWLLKPIAWTLWLCYKLPYETNQAVLSFFLMAFYIIEPIITVFIWISSPPRISTHPKGRKS